MYSSIYKVITILAITSGVGCVQYPAPQRAQQSITPGEWMYYTVTNEQVESIMDCASCNGEGARTTNTETQISNRSPNDDYLITTTMSASCTKINNQVIKGSSNTNQAVVQINNRFNDSSTEFLQELVSGLSSSNGLKFSGQIRLRDLGSSRNATTNGRDIDLDIGAYNRFSKNTIAFIVGHELAHIFDSDAQRGSGKSTLDIETSADIIGAEYAICSGYDFERHINEISIGPNGGRPSAEFQQRINRMRNHVYTNRINC